MTTPAPRTTPSGARLLAVPDAETAASLTATLLHDAVTASLAERGVARVALSGGRTPLAAYAQLGPAIRDWSAVTVLLADERCVPQDHPDSNAREIRAALGPAARDLRLVPLVENGSPGDRARAYAHDLGPEPIDVVLLGLGEDGHTASLFPAHGALEAEGRTVAVLDAPKPPPERVSLTLPELRAAGSVVLLVTGEGKADALARTLGDPGQTAPASLLRPETLTVVADADALRRADELGLAGG